MAKVTGQSVPSEDKHAYEACLELSRADGTVRKRFPKRINAHPLPAKLAQQARFLEAISLFKTISSSDKQRWFDAMPEWGSYLWYYNYFIMSALAGNAYIDSGGCGVIKSIQVVKDTVPTTGGKSFTISEVDPAKTVVMLYGNSYISDTVQRGTDTISDGDTNNHALSPSVDPSLCEVIIRGEGGRMELSEGTGDGDWAAPYCSALTTSQLSVSMVNTSMPVTCGYAWEVIEHKAQTIFPVLVSKAATSIVVDWSLVPSVAADVSILVIEYI